MSSSDNDKKNADEYKLIINRAYHAFYTNTNKMKTHINKAYQLALVSCVSLSALSYL
jgi:SMC interacting uncharacterized protein involved in chromosome segregation